MYCCTVCGLQIEEVQEILAKSRPAIRSLFYRKALPSHWVVQKIMVEVSSLTQRHVSLSTSGRPHALRGHVSLSTNAVHSSSLQRDTVTRVAPHSIYATASVYSSHCC